MQPYYKKIDFEKENLREDMNLILWMVVQTTLHTSDWTENNYSTLIVYMEYIAVIHAVIVSYPRIIHLVVKKTVHVIFKFSAAFAYYCDVDT